MTIWIIWVVTIVIVIAIKYYALKTLSQKNLDLTANERHLSTLTVESNLVRSSLDVTKRNLADILSITAGHERVRDKLVKELKELEEKEDNEIEETKKKISREKGS